MLRACHPKSRCRRRRRHRRRCHPATPVTTEPVEPSIDKTPLIRSAGNGVQGEAETEIFRRAGVSEIRHVHHILKRTKQTDDTKPVSLC